MEWLAVLMALQLYELHEENEISLPLIHCLSPVVLSNLFSYLSFYSLDINSCILVCRQWFLMISNTYLPNHSPYTLISENINKLSNIN